MDDQEKMLQKMREIALKNPENIRIIETSVDSDIQIEFFENLQKVGNDNTIYDIQALYSELKLDVVDVERKKDVIAILTTQGEVESYRLLEEYVKNPAAELKTWAFLAVQQARMFLESKLLEESKIYIASGLGGKDHRLRYGFSFASRSESLTSTQQNTVKGELVYFLKKNDSFIEDISFHDQYVICTALIPIYIDIIELLQEIVLEVNQYGDFLRKNVFITNEKLINVEDLKEMYNIEEEV